MHLRKKAALVGVSAASGSTGMLNLPGGSSKLPDDYFIYSDEEQIVSRNYLLFLDDKFSSTRVGDDDQQNSDMATGFGGSSSSSNMSGGVQSNKFRPGDKLIIKAKVYILEILEVRS